jgi:hypothetical protein
MPSAIKPLFAEVIDYAGQYHNRDSCARNKAAPKAELAGLVVIVD